MLKVRDEYVAFGALLFITGTGLAIIVVGACLLSWAAYLSPWMPSWVWMSVSAFTALGVGITASSSATAIATVAPRPQAAHKCLVVLLIFLGIEIGMSALGAVRQPVWSVHLYHQVQQTMTDSLDAYSTNASSAAMWDEIQNEVSCCGVQSYSDWFVSGFGDGNSVPEACCLLPSVGCGQGVKGHNDIEDIIDTEGCLPTLATSWTTSYRMLTRRALLPICVIQIIMVTVIVLTYRRAGLLAGHIPLRIARPPAPVFLPRATKAADGPPQYSLMA